jgi:hypothetical protein
MTKQTENTEFATQFMTMNYVEVKDIYTYLDEYLTYLINLYKTYVICFNKKDDYDKLVLEAKITKLTERVNRLKLQLDKYPKDELTTK